MKTTVQSLSLLLLAGLPLLSRAEGSKQLTPNTTGTPTSLTDPANTRAGFLTHDVDTDNASLGFLKPASWTGSGGTIGFSEDYRMYVRVLPGETLNYGVHRMARSGSTSVQSDLILTLRYGAGAGTVVQQSTLLRNPLSTNQSELLPGMGVISSAAAAQVGPYPLSGGYSPLQYTNNTGTAQDIYVEFIQVDEASMTDDAKRSEYDFWDFTVRDASGAEKPGRLFSKHWAFSAGQSTGTSQFLNRLSADFKLFPLVESRQNPGQYYVKEVELAGMRPFVFYFVCNEFGSSTAVGTTVETRRQSQTSRTSYPQYPSFVNNPDPALWPSAPLPTVGVTPQVYCRGGRNEVAFTTNSAEAGEFDILIDLNGTPGYQAGSTDRLLQQTVSAGVLSTVIWDGKNGLGVDVADNTTVTFNFTSKGAPVNFPVYDAEGNPDGFRVRNVRPASGATYDLLYWDDTNLTNFPAAIRTGQLLGADSAPGVHPWGVNADEGNAYTVNSWTYGFSVFQGNRTFVFRSACDFDLDGVSDAADIDDDNDGILDAVEAFSPTGSGATAIDPSAFASSTSPTRYLDRAFVHPVLGAFLDTNNDGVNDLFDTDRDGMPNHMDLDADGDGLTDAFEANGNVNPTSSFTQTSGSGGGSSYTVTSSYNAAAGRYVGTGNSNNTSFNNGVGSNGLPDAVEVTVTYSGNRNSPSVSENGISRYTLTDRDNDARTAGSLTVRNYNFLDIDSDNDGITDEIEVQPTTTYTGRQSNLSLFYRDSDADGIRDAYDANNGGTAISSTLNTNVGTNADADMFDRDSDGDNAVRTTLPIYDQTADWSEGFDDNGNGVSGDDFVARAAAFTAQNPTKAGYYTVNTVGASRSPFLQDANANGLPNFLEPGSGHYYDDNFNGLVDLLDPAYGGSPSTAPRAAGASEAAFRTSGNAVPLPVELISFQARAAGRDASLTWATAQEIRNAGFEVERSTNGTDFARIGYVAGRGTTAQRSDYRFLDQGIGARPGTVYYRLRQVDTDGASKHTNVSVVTFDGKGMSKLAAVFPNPTAAGSTLDLTALPAGTYQVLLHGAEGRYIGTLQAEGGTLVALPSTGLAKGMYLVSINGNGISQVIKLVKE